MKQTQELMTQGHAYEQSPDYAVTQMSKDVEAIGVHAPHKISKLQRAAQCPPNMAPVSGNLKEYLLKALCTRAAVCGSPEPRASGTHKCMVTRCSLCRGALKGAPNNQACEMGRPGQDVSCREVFRAMSPEEGLFPKKSLGPEGRGGEYDKVCMG